MSEIYHHQIDLSKISSSRYVWECESTKPFNELIISWNASRPSTGRFIISVSIKTHEWSSSVPYAFWGSDSQAGNQIQDDLNIFTIFLDVLSINNDKFALGFRIEIVAEDHANLNEFYALHAYASRRAESDIQTINHALSDVQLDVPSISQMLLQHPRHAHICSPTSTTSVLRYLLKNHNIDPVPLALKAYDCSFDIFGHWSLNVAEASSILGKEWHCWVQKLKGFDAIHQRLQMDTPVVVSVKGPLNGSAKPYLQGHLIVVRGYDAKNQRVLCMDPAFPSDEATKTSYALDDFLEAWRRRDCIAYLFERMNPLQ